MLAHWRWWVYPLAAFFALSLIGVLLVGFAAPMLAAMERNGHLPGVRPWHVWAYRRAVEPAGT